jgi:hypothetical protein
MRKLGIALVLIGFCWIIFSMFEFTVYQYSLWMRHAKEMSVENVTRDVASSRLSELALALNKRHRIVMIPATLMLIGGLICAFQKSEKEK